jgi:ATP adenylyltransferase
MSSTFDHLARFLRAEMRMSHIYQPVMIKTLLQNRGSATTRTIAAAFLAEDESQLEYYEMITNRMPGPVLRRRGIVERQPGEYRLNDDFSFLSPDEVQSLVALCDEAITKFKAARGAAIWEHRAVGLGQIPGTLRYETLKRAGFRCELCGIPAGERALDVDHIVPRKAGGSDSTENLQALCWLCNTNKGAGDDTDFRHVDALHAHREAGCIFCEIARERLLAQNSLAFVVRDAFAVTPLHTLVIPKRHVANYFDLFSSEERAIQQLLRQARTIIVQDDGTVTGFNVGINAGTAAGQTVMHCHVHLIPRRDGDTPNPCGGVRGVIPGRADY